MTDHNHSEAPQPEDLQAPKAPSASSRPIPIRVPMAGSVRFSQRGWFLVVTVVAILGVLGGWALLSHPNATTSTAISGSATSLPMPMNGASTKVSGLDDSAGDTATVPGSHTSLPPIGRRT